MLKKDYALIFLFRDKENFSEQSNLFTEHNDGFHLKLVKFPQSFENLLHGFEKTFITISRILEPRDSFTFIHQKRVTQLVCRIAEEMGLDKDTIYGLKLAAMVHDVGKITIPLEIINKPGKLTTEEYNIVKTHSEAGYNILKAIESPWHIAQIVHQHHERLNGSGYPRGISTDDILLESRILAVADVVEAMTADRPYRKGLGINVAIDEITSNSGVLYDESVVEACSNVFNQKGFMFNNECFNA
ncbi:HD-GYP domain-containing protein [bacterium]|nr:HD-GYP domain-containing protein [bacterium]